jgi:hypothetical protein
MSGAHGFHLPHRKQEQQGKWLPYEEQISPKLKIAFIILTLVLGAICYALMQSHSGHSGGHH